MLILTVIFPGHTPEGQPLYIMGKPHNQVINRKRRKAYLKRKQAAAKK